MSYSDNNSFEQILERLMSNSKLSELDKRQGSVIYDSLAPAAMELADCYAMIDILEEQTYLLTATGINLENRVFDFGIKRKPATYSKRIASFKKYKLNAEGVPETDEEGNKILVNMDIPIGSRFAVPSNTVDITYTYTGKQDTNYILTCDQLGSIGDRHEGIILPIDSIQGLIEARITGTYQPANDVETDDELRKRTQAYINNSAYGGNIYDYIQKLKEIDGVGNAKVFPAWKLNGSVLVSVVSSAFEPISNEFIKLIKKQIDPEEMTGQGVGIAPIGHYVTVTTPVKKVIDIKLEVDLEPDVLIGNVKSDIKNNIEKYFNVVRHQFEQDKILAIYKAKIIDSALVTGVLNVKTVLLNNENKDIIMKDEPNINTQYLPFTGEVTIE